MRGGPATVRPYDLLPQRNGKLGSSGPDKMGHKGKTKTDTQEILANKKHLLCKARQRGEERRHPGPNRRK